MGKMTKTDGGPAFPVVAENGLGHVADGMSLRDWFAGQALAGIVAKSPFTIESAGATLLVQQSVGGAYDYADAMLAERTRERARAA
jgi:hypothetical protein